MEKKTKFRIISGGIVVLMLLAIAEIDVIFYFLKIGFIGHGVLAMLVILTLTIAGCGVVKGTLKPIKTPGMLSFSVIGLLAGLILGSLSLLFSTPMNPVILFNIIIGLAVLLGIIIGIQFEFVKENKTAK